MAKRDDPQVKLRLPADLKEWLDQEAEANRSTRASEIVRAVRERRERCLQEPGEHYIG